MEVLAFGLLVATIYAFGQLWFARLFDESGIPAGRWLIVLSGLLSAVLAPFGGIDWLIGSYLGMSAGLVIYWSVVRWLKPLRPPKIWEPDGYIAAISPCGDFILVRYEFDVPYQCRSVFSRDFALGRYRIPVLEYDHVFAVGNIKKASFSPEPLRGFSVRLV